MRHVIEFPGGQWLNKKQFVEATGMPAKSLDRLIAAGFVSPPTGDNDRVQRWHWSEVYAVAQLWPKLLEKLESQETQAEP